eukprot:scaffold219726_cov40-Tisochrysis_lutea.AAC.3
MGIAHEFEQCLSTASSKKIAPMCEGGDRKFKVVLVLHYALYVALVLQLYAHWTLAGRKEVFHFVARGKVSL